MSAQFYRAMQRDRVGLRVSMVVFSVIAVFYTWRGLDGLVFAASTRWTAAGNLLAAVVSAYAVGFFHHLRKRMAETERQHRELDRRSAELNERYRDVH
jgi:hypothetical protein